jgi:hypothetical protein
MRSYLPPKDALPYSKTDDDLDDNTIRNITIRDAVRATSAAPMYFPELPLKTSNKNSVVFWDGGVLNNNPIDQLWRARLDLVDTKDPAPKVACVLSLGTSFCPDPAPESGFIKGLKAYLKPDPSDGWVTKATKETASAVITPILEMWTKPAGRAMEFLTNTDAKHVDFGRYMLRIKNRTDEADKGTQYFRFNCPTPGQQIDMAMASEMQGLKETTENWLNKDMPHKNKIDEVARLLVKTKAKK